MANIKQDSSPVTRAITPADDLTAQSVFNWWGTPQLTEISYYNRIKTYFFPAPRFSPRRSAIRIARAPVPTWKITLYAFLADHFNSIVQNIRVTLNRARLITMSPNDQTLAGGNVVGSTNNTSNTGTVNASSNATLTTSNRVNWIHNDRLPRELRDKIYKYLLPSNILIRDGVFDAPDLANILVINSQSNKEIRDLMQDYIFEFTSITAMLSALESAPALCLAPYKKLTVRVNGPYNGHSNIYGNNNGWHRTNICPTFRRDRDTVWFETGYTCLDCEDEPFAQRELKFAVPTLLRLFEPLIGLQCPRSVYVRTFAWRDGPMVPHFRAYRLSVSKWPASGSISSASDKKANISQEIWQPWKPVLPNMFGTTFNQDCLDFLYVDGGDDDNDLADGLWYAAPGTPRGLGDRIEGDMTYLIL